MVISSDMISSFIREEVEDCRLKPVLKAMGSQTINLEFKTAISMTDDIRLGSLLSIKTELFVYGIIARFTH